MPDSEDILALMDFLAMGDIGEVTRLLNVGVDINVRDAMGETALMEAAHTGQADMVRLLLERGADASLICSILNMTAFRKAKLIPHQDVLAVFAEFGIKE